MGLRNKFTPGAASSGARSALTGRIRGNTRITYAFRSLLRPILYHHPPIGLRPARLQLWLATLLETRELPGSALEIGCFTGGTSVMSARMLRQEGIERRYVAIDTFGGFVDRQFDADSGRGTRESDRRVFSANSIGLVRRIAAGLGSPEIEFIEGDIVRMPESRLPDPIAACLIDVDLSEPVYVALTKVWPRLAPGGRILVDDCPEETSWKARDGYVRFCAEDGLPERFAYGMGIVEKSLS